MMKKQISSKVAIFVILGVLVLSIGAVSFASVMWTHLVTCGYAFAKDDSLSTSAYDVVTCGASTTTSTGKYAYAKYQLQQLQSSGTWKNYYSNDDLDYVIAGVSDSIQVTPGYTYRLRITHQVQDANGNVLEEYIHNSSNYFVSPAR